MADWWSAVEQFAADFHPRATGFYAHPDGKRIGFKSRGRYRWYSHDSSRGILVAAGSTKDRQGANKVHWDEL